MVHPYSGNTVAVCNKITIARTDDRSIRTIHANTTVIGFDHLPYLTGFHQQK